MFMVTRIIGSVLDNPDAIIRVRSRHIEAQLRLAAQQLLKITDDIRIPDCGNHVIAGLHVMNNLVEFKDIHRPWKILKMELKMPAHITSFPTPWCANGNDRSWVQSHTTTKNMPPDGTI
jgi:hypothetical protein